VPELRDDAPTHNTPYRAGKGFLYEGGLRVPLIVRWPGKVKANTVRHMPVVNTDLMPTLCELIGVTAPAGLDGVSYAGLLLGSAKPRAAAGRPLYWHFPHYNNQGGRPGGAVREGDWKLVEYYDTDTAELYDLARDAGEENDLAGREAKRVLALLAKLAAWRKSVGAQTNRPNPDFDEALYRKLYVEVDVSRLKPARTAAEMTPKLAAWRKLMDAAVRQKPAAKSSR
jgi:arylsulfatase A-like enzyme